jgi:predicted small lipoprotein YifL
MKTSTNLIRSMLLICFLGLMTACGGEKGTTSESAEHGHSHE